MSALVELYRLVESGISPRVWTYTSADRDVEYNGETYVATVISRTKAESKNDLARSNLTLKMSILDPDARRWMLSTDKILVLTIYEVDEGGDTGVLWKGRLSSVKPTPTEVHLVMESIFTSMRRPGLRARYLRTCRHSLYGTGCGVDKAAFAIQVTPTGMSGLTLTVPAAASYPDGWFTTGMVESLGGDFRFILSHTGSLLTLGRDWPMLAAEIAGYGNHYGNHYGELLAKLYPGCSRTRSVCNSKFDNLMQYGGFDWIPLRNPFDGSPIM